MPQSLQRFRDFFELMAKLERRMLKAASFKSAMTALIRDLCRLDWDYGEAWKRTPDGTRMEFFTAAAKSDTARIRSFQRRSTRLKIRPGEGLVGHVWKSRRAFWIRDGKETCPAKIRRADCPKRWEAAFGVPVQEGHVYLVLVFYMKCLKKDNEWLQYFALTVSQQLGRHLRYKEVESNLQKKAEAYRQVLSELEIRVKEGNAGIARPIERSILPALWRLKQALPSAERKRLEMVTARLKKILTSRGGKSGMPLLSGLSLREAEVAEMLRFGLPAKEIASILHLSVRTVEVHTRNIRKKLKIPAKSRMREYLARHNHAERGSSPT